MRSSSASARSSSAPVDIVEAGLVDYEQAWARQRRLAEDRAADLVDDTLLLLEHPSVYTAGRRTEPSDRPVDGSRVIDVDRGGKITWHGPGQLVGYPVVKLAEPVDVVDYVRRIEEALICVCAGLGVACGRVEGRSGVWLPATTRDGVWLPERKIAAIGVRVQRGVTLHGFALNCDADLSAFGAIVPCGISDAGVTSLTRELGRVVTVAEVLPAATEAVLGALDGAIPVSPHEIDRHPAATPTAPATQRSGPVPVTTLRL